MAVTGDNPLYDIPEALWKMLEASTSFCAMVPVVNRMRTTAPDDSQEGQPVEDGIVASEMPKVRIVQIGLPQVQAFKDSSQSGMTIRYAIQVASGNPYSNDVWDVQWSVLRAFLNWVSYLRDELTYEDVTYVRWCRTLQAEDMEKDRTQDWDITAHGWSTALACEVGCEFITATLQETA